MNRFAFFRISRIVWMSVKFFIQIILFQRQYKGRFTPSVNEKWELLVTKQAKEYKRIALDLGGLMIKMGQFLSTRADIMPPSFIAELEGLTDHVTAVPKKKAINLLEDEWNMGYEEYLSSLSDGPVASASIGEVYKAVLKDGTPVAVKIQRPDIERILRVDFRAMKIVIWLIKKFTTFNKQIDVNLLYKEMVDTIGAELNFLQELKNGRAFAKRFATMPYVRFPVYYDALSTRRVLVMDWIEGSRITDINYLDKNGINRRELSERLFRLFLEQVLDGGQFHADPHGGNILVQEDGTLFLIDFGMIVNIKPDEARSILKIVEGIIFKQYDQVLDGLEKLKFLLPNADRLILADAIESVVTAYEANDLNEMNSFIVDRLLDDLKEIVRTQPVQLPAEFAFLGRAVSIFIGVLHVLDPNVDLLSIGRPRILDWAKKQTLGNRSFLKDDAKRFVLNTIGPLRSVPKKVISFLDEPTRMREYMQTRDLKREKERSHLQTRMFTGAINVLSLAAIFFSVWDSHLQLLVTSGIFFLGSAWVFMQSR